LGEPIYLDQRSKNILWKVATPGWSDSQPIVIGKRVVHVASLHHVTCYDADTGSVLWKDELKAMHLPVLAEDRKTLTPAPTPEQAAKLQKLYERSVAVERAARGACFFPRDYKGPGDVTIRLPLIRQLVASLEGWKAETEADFPGLGAAIDTSLTTIRAYIADPLLLKHLPEGRGYRDVEREVMAFCRAAEKITGLNAESGWDGFLSITMATPVSDGEIVAVTIGNGQTAAYEMATGKRLWAFRDPDWNTRSASHIPSPLLWKDVVIVPSGSRTPQPPPGLTPSTLRGIDKRTGKVLWESSQGPDGNYIGQSHGDHMGPCLVRLPDGKGGLKGLVVGARGAIVDAETGAQVGFLPSNAKYRGAGYQQSVNGLVVNNSGGDNYTPPAEITALSWKDDKLVVGPLVPTPTRGAGQGPFLITDRHLFMGRTIYSLPDGGIFRSLPESQSFGTSCGEASSLAGNRLITHASLCDETARTRADLMCLMSFRVRDFSDLSFPLELSNRSLIGDSSLPKDPTDEHIPGFAKPEFKLHSMGAYRGIGSHFGARLAGVTCHGDRIYLASNMHLYGIGREALGSPKDDPKALAAIAAATTADALAAHLTSERPRHRREALLRLLALKTPPVGDMKATIEKLLIEDLFEEVRAAALQVLDAADPAQRPGSARLLAFRNDPQIKDWQKDPQVVRQWDGIVETLRVLPADQAKASLEHALSGTPDPNLLLMYCDLARRLKLPIPRLTDLALEAVAKSGGRSPYAHNPERYTDIEYLALIVWQDPRVFPVLLAAHPWCDAVPLSAMARLPVDQLPAAIESIVVKRGMGGEIPFALETGLRRLEPAQRLPLIEKLVAQVKPEVATQLNALKTRLTQP
jgi:hypothetical protein